MGTNHNTIIFHSDADTAADGRSIFYAASVDTTGVVWFHSAEDRQAWLDDHGGFTLTPSQVDPAIRTRAIERTTD